MAQFLHSRDEQENLAALEQLLAQMQQAWQAAPSTGFSQLPDTLSAADLLPFYTTRNVLPLGISMEDNQPVYMDLRSKHHMLISGSTAEEAEKALANTAQLLRLREDNQIYLLDGNHNLQGFARQDNGLQYAADSQELNQAVETIYDQLMLRDDALCDYEDSGNTLDGDAFALQYPQICVLINEMHSVMQQLSEKNRQRLLQLSISSAPLGMIAIGAGTCADIGMYMCMEDLTIAFVDSAVSDAVSDQAVNRQKGLCVGGAIRNHDAFTQTMLQREQRNTQLGQNEGFVFDCGNGIRIKPMA